MCAHSCEDVEQTAFPRGSERVRRPASSPLEGDGDALAEALLDAEVQARRHRAVGAHRHDPQHRELAGEKPVRGLALQSSKIASPRTARIQVRPMFDFVHKNKRIIQIFLGLIALTFATWGIESYTRMAGVSTCDGSKLPPSAWRSWSLRRRSSSSKSRAEISRPLTLATVSRPPAMRV